FSLHRSRAFCSHKDTTVYSNWLAKYEQKHS
ncbi:MAG: hypothetical protein ACJAUV_001860, partial [Flavobacteriales bacterium]